MTPARSDDSQSDDLTGLLRDVARDTGRLVGQHAELLRSEMREGVRGLAPAAAAVGAGAGLAAAGGILGSLMVVHGLHRTTRLPLWACYGLAGGLLTAAGVGLIRSGTRRATHLSLVPRETIAALREDLEWLREQSNLTNS